MKQKPLQNLAGTQRFFGTIPLPLRPLLTPLVLALAGFLLLSGTLGMHIIREGILYRDHFAWYGPLGKIAIFSLVALVLLVWPVAKQNGAVSFRGWRRSQAVSLLVSVLLASGAWLIVQKLVAGDHRLFVQVAAHGALFGSVIALGAGTLGLLNARRFWHSYRREALLALAAGVGFFALLELTYALWPILSATVLHACAWLLSAIGIPTQVFPDYILVTDRYSVKIAQYCSGVESLALFSGLYLLVGLIDHKRFNMHRYWLLLPLGLLGAFLVNILRVLILLLVAYYIDQNLGFNLFHTYAGLILSFCYYWLFWTMICARIYKSH